MFMIHLCSSGSSLLNFPTNVHSWIKPNPTVRTRHKTSM